MLVAGGALEVAVVCGVLLAASTLHASFGFGTALVAQPLLALALGFEAATPLVGLAALTSVGAILARERHGLDLTAAWRLVAASLVGIPCGLLLIAHAPLALLKTLLGLTLLAWGAYNVARPRLPRLEAPWLVWPAGFVAGVLGAAFNTNAPPVVVHGALHGWSPARLRATLQAYFLPTAILICAAHALAGLWTRQVFTLFLAALPAIALGNVLGTLLAQRLALAAFTRALYAVLALLGALLLI